jgi:hypothetical protein
LTTSLSQAVDANLHAGIVAAAAAGGISISAWMTEAAARALVVIPVGPAPVVARVSRSNRQAQLRRFLRGCDIVDFCEADAHAAGRVLGATRASQPIVDA